MNKLFLIIVTLSVCSCNLTSGETSVANKSNDNNSFAMSAFNRNNLNRLIERVERSCGTNVVPTRNFVSRNCSRYIEGTQQGVSGLTYCMADTFSLSQVTGGWDLYLMDEPASGFSGLRATHCAAEQGDEVAIFKLLLLSKTRKLSNGSFCLVSMRDLLEPFPSPQQCDSGPIPRVLGEYLVTSINFDELVKFFISSHKDILRHGVTENDLAAYGCDDVREVDFLGFKCGLPEIWNLIGLTSQSYIAEGILLNSESALLISETIAGKIQLDSGGESNNELDN